MRSFPPRSPTVRALLPLIAISTCLGRAAGPAAAAFLDSPDAALKLVPPDAQAAIIVPNLKSLSDQITQCLEGMDRANVLMGSRPLDQLKSALGFNVGIDDAGSMAIVTAATQEPRPTPVFVIPVTDSEAFLRGNFTSHDGDAYKLADGRTLYAKTIGSHVALSPSAEAARGYEPGDGVAVSLKAALGERGAALLGRGEILVIARREALQQLLGAAQATAAQSGRPVAGAERAAAAIRNVDVVVLAMDFDPLGLIARSYTRFAPQGELAKFAAGGAGGGGGAGLSRLPNKPFYLAASIDIAGLGGADVMRGLMAAAGLPEPPAWMLQAQSVQFAAYPSPAGLAGGLLNDAVAALGTPQPAEARAALKTQMLAMQNGGAGVTRQVVWEDNKPLNDGSAADAYEVKVLEAPPAQAQQQLAWRMIFGQAGWRGFVKQVDGALLMTFSQRPAVLAAAVQAWSAAGKDANAGLAGMPAIKAMRAWLPAHADVEMFWSVGQIAQLAGQVVNSLGGIVVIELPAIDASLPPVGFAADVCDGGIETAAVIPAGVCAVIFDQAMLRKAPVHDEPVRQPQDDAPR